MIRIPKKVRPGDPITAQSYNDLLDVVASLGIAPGTGYRIKRTPGGQVLTIKPGKGGGSVVAGGCTALKPTLALESAVWKLRISAGFSGDVVPDFAGGNLADVTPPAGTVSGATKLWLVAEWEPGIDDDGAGTYWITSGGSLVAADFELAGTRPSETVAAVSETGTVTNGTYVFQWAEISSDGAGGYVISANRCGNHQFTFCPDSLKLLFD